MEKDLVSIIVPVHNTARYLGDCLLSIINQTYKNIEIIIVNDGSNDYSEEIALQYQKIDNRIKYYYKTQSGCGDTRNYGLDKAKGQYVYFMDSDDYIAPTMIEKLHSAIKPEDSFAATAQFYTDTNGEIKYYNRTEQEQRLFKSPNVFTRLYNKKILDESSIRFSKAKVGEDLEFNFKLLVYNNHSTYINEALYYYRIHPTSTMQNKNTNKLAILEAIDGIENYVKEQNKKEEFYNLLEFVNVVHVLYAVKNIILQDEYDENDVNKGINYLMSKYPDWHNNIYIKDYFIKELSVFKEIIERKKNNLDEVIKPVKIGVQKHIGGLYS